MLIFTDHSIWLPSRYKFQSGFCHPQVKPAKAGITKHVAKLWATGIEKAGGANPTGVAIARQAFNFHAQSFLPKFFVVSVQTYMASPSIMEDYQEALNKAQNQSSSRVQTMQCFFQPNDQVALFETHREARYPLFICFF